MIVLLAAVFCVCYGAGEEGDRISSGEDLRAYVKEQPWQGLLGKRLFWNGIFLVFKVLERCGCTFV